PARTAHGERALGQHGGGDVRGPAALHGAEPAEADGGAGDARGGGHGGGHDALGDRGGGVARGPGVAAGPAALHPRGEDRLAVRVVRGGGGGPGGQRRRGPAVLGVRAAAGDRLPDRGRHPRPQRHGPGQAAVRGHPGAEHLAAHPDRRAEGRLAAAAAAGRVGVLGDDGGAGAGAGRGGADVRGAGGVAGADGPGDRGGDRRARSVRRGPRRIGTGGLGAQAGRQRPAMKGYLWTMEHPTASGEGLPALARWEAMAVDAVGNAIEFWGFKRNQGRVWALLYLRGTPMSAGQLEKELSLSKGAVSMLIRDLERWGVIERVREPGG